MVLSLLLVSVASKTTVRKLPNRSNGLPNPFAQRTELCVGIKFLCAHPNRKEHSRLEVLMGTSQLGIDTILAVGGDSTKGPIRQ